MAPLFRTHSMGLSARAALHNGMSMNRGKGGVQERRRLLAVDDQQDILDALRLMLGSHGYELETLRNPQAAREAIATGSFDAALIDLNYTRDTTSGQEGLALLTEIVSMDSSLPVIVMTAWGNV